MARPPAAGTRRAPELDLCACMACGQVCEVTGAFNLPVGEQAERYVRTRCVLGHLMVGPEFALRPVAA